MFFKKKPSSSYDFILAGLGNPGLQYEQSRHNVGFRVIDLFCKENNITNFRLKFHSYIADGEICGKRVIIAKPQTYMNLSGQALGEISRFYKIPPENVIVMFDDISLPLGKIRVRAKGSAGGHNGIKDIIAVLGSENFPRIKVGVGDKPNPDYELKDWVLGKFSKEENEKFNSAALRAVNAAKEIIRDGNCEGAMNKYNG